MYSFDKEQEYSGRTFEITSAVSAKLEQRCNPVRARKSSINRIPILYPLSRVSWSPFNHEGTSGSHLVQLFVDFAIVFIVLNHCQEKFVMSRRAARR